MLFFVKKHVNLKTVNHRDFDFLKFEVDETKCWNNYYEYVIFFSEACFNKGDTSNMMGKLKKCKEVK